MLRSFIFWMWFVGLVYLTGGLIAARTELAATRGMERWIRLGPVFVAAPLATFAAEHFVDAQSLAQIVPAWMPAHLFWAYFVGCALLAAASSIIARKFVQISATLLGVMFLLFVLMMDLPFAIAHPRERLGWILMLRETAFGGGAWALASQVNKRPWMALFGRLSMAFAVILFAFDQLRHPEFAPGVPDSKLTPDWVPLHKLWGYPVGALLLVAGIALLLHFKPRTAAAWIGVLMTLLTALLYLPILAITRDPSQMTEAINFVADTLLFGGTALLVAGALPLQE